MLDGFSLNAVCRWGNIFTLRISLCMISSIGMGVQNMLVFMNYVKFNFQNLIKFAASGVKGHLKVQLH